MESREKVSVVVLRVREKSGEMLLSVMARVTSVDSIGITTISEKKSEF